jgi:hypothetical protein
MYFTDITAHLEVRDPDMQLLAKTTKRLSLTTRNLLRSIETTKKEKFDVVRELERLDRVSVNNAVHC